jgi:hypothetical protein
LALEDFFKEKLLRTPEPFAQFSSNFTKRFILESLKINITPFPVKSGFE